MTRKIQCGKINDFRSLCYWLTCVCSHDFSWYEPFRFELFRSNFFTFLNPSTSRLPTFSTQRMLWNLFGACNTPRISSRHTHTYSQTNRQYLPYWHICWRHNSQLSIHSSFFAHWSIRMFRHIFWVMKFDIHTWKVLDRHLLHISTDKQCRCCIVFYEACRYQPSVCVRSPFMYILCVCVSMSIHCSDRASNVCS